MSRARSSVAARTTIPKLHEAALKAYGNREQVGEPVEFPDFDAVIDFCDPRTEELGGEPGKDAWYLHQVGDWAVLGDLGMLLQRDPETLARLSAELNGELIVCAIDSAFNYAYLAAYDRGKMKRRLILEDEEYSTEGLPVPAEKGRPLVMFDEEEADRIWTSYGLPTFEYDPLEGPFRCLELQRTED
jgi:hypothetical protein